MTETMNTQNQLTTTDGSSLDVDPRSALQELNRKYGVLESVDDLRGWHLVEAELCKPGVYRIVTSRYTNGGAEMRHGFASQQIITTARELGYLSAPNGFTLPNTRSGPLVSINFSTP